MNASHAIARLLALAIAATPAHAGWFGHKKREPKKLVRVKRKSAPAVRVPITALDVAGNENVSREVILLAIPTKRGDAHSDERLKKDVETLRRLGYFGSVEPHIAPWQGGVRITFRVVENPVIRKVQIEGNALLPSKRLVELLGVRTGTTLNLTQLQDGIKAINRAYSDRGYAFCGVLDNQQLSIEPRSGTLKLRVLEPRLRKLTVRGNKKTRPDVITREMRGIKRGRLLKLEDIKRAMRDVHNLGYFEDVKPPEPKLDLANRTIDLALEVKEQKTGTASLGGGYSSVNGFVGFVDVAESNFRGRGQTVRAKYQFGGEQSFLFSFVEPWLLDRPVSAGASVYRTRVQREQFAGGTNMNRFSEQRTGYGLSSGWRIGRDARLSASFTDERLRLDANVASRGSIRAALPDDLKVFDTSGTNVVEFDEQSLGLSWTLDRRDSFQLPRAGWRLSVGATVTGGWLQGINGFNKYVADYRTYRAISLAGRSTVALRVRAGTTDVTDGRLRFIDRFAAGGNDSVRGFQDREFTGADFAVANFELRRDFSRVVGAALFIDAGDAWRADGRRFDPKASAGAGLRVTTPLGPFRLDYGMPIGEERSGRLHFGIGQSF